LGAASAIARALEVVLMVLGYTIALAVFGGLAYLVHRARSGHSGLAITARRPVPPNRCRNCHPLTSRRSAPAVSWHIHLHWLTPDQLAAIVTRSGAHLQEDP
jgi:hypothetical protein